MYRYKIAFLDRRGVEFDSYLSTSMFLDRGECALAGEDFCRRFRIASPSVRTSVSVCIE